MRSGVSALLRADMPAAQDNFSEAVMLDNKYAEAHNKLSALYHRAGNYYTLDLHLTLILTLTMTFTLNLTLTLKLILTSAVNLN